MTWDTTGYGPDRQGGPGRSRITVPEFEYRVWLAATHMAVGVLIANRDPEGWEDGAPFVLEDYVVGKRQDEGMRDFLDQLSPDEREEVERLSTAIADDLSMTMVRHFDVVPVPEFLRDVHDLAGG